LGANPGTNLMITNNHRSHLIVVRDKTAKKERSLTKLEHNNQNVILI